MQFGKYLKAAFLNRWNLLAFMGSAGFALLSGQADVLLPLVLATEAAYVGLLGSHRKFQMAVDAQDAKALRDQGAAARQRTLQHIVRALPKELLDRFESIRSRCQELRRIAQELRRPGMDSADLPLEDSQVAGLDRLLWIHLRLLYTQHALSRFLEKTSEKRIRADVDRLQQQIDRLGPDKDQPRQQRIHKALQDNLETSLSRLANLQKARENHQLVELEIDRLENKIRSLAEMAVNRQEPEFVSSQVDSVASSMLDTERTMNELQFATGLNALDDEAPELLRVKGG